MLPLGRALKLSMKPFSHGLPGTVPSYERWNLGRYRDFQHRGFRFGPGLRYNPFDGIEIIEAWGVAAMALEPPSISVARSAPIQPSHRFHRIAIPHDSEVRF